MKVKLDSIFCLDAASKNDVLRLAGPAVDSPPAEWATASPHELSETWDLSSADRGPTIETWTDVSHPGSHTSNPDWPGYDAPTTPNKSWRLDAELPAGWYTRMSERKV
jgi:hypothetical protein